MKFNIDINPAVVEEKITMTVKELRQEVTELSEKIERLVNKKQLYGRREEEIYPIDEKQIVRVFVEDKIVMAVHMNGKHLRLNERLYQLEEQLSYQFVRISKSEIINIHHINHLELKRNGMIQLVMKNGDRTYSSRKYLKTVKERLEL